MLNCVGGRVNVLFFVVLCAGAKGGVGVAAIVLCRRQRRFALFQFAHVELGLLRLLISLINKL